MTVPASARGAEGFVLAFVLLVVLLPVGALVVQGALTAQRAGDLGTLVTDPVTVRAAQNSLVQGAGGALGSLLLGVPAGLALGRYRFPGRSTLEGALLVPFLLPSLLMVAGVGALFGPLGWFGGPLPDLRPLATGLPAILLADALYDAPVVALLTAVGASSGAARLEETAAVLGARPARVFRDVWGRGALVGASAGATLAFALSALAFAAPLALGGPANYTLEARIWSLDAVLAQPGAAAVVAGLALLLLLPPSLLYLRLLRRLRPREAGVARPGRPVRGGGPMAVAAMAGLLLLLGLEAALLLSVLVRLAGAGSRAAGGGSAFFDLFGPRLEARLGFSTGGALANSAFFAAAAAALALLVALAQAYGARARRRGRPAFLAGLPLLALLVSPVVLALGLATFWRPAVGGESGVWVLIVLSQAALALPFVVQTLGVALGRVPPALGEAARSLGAAPLGAFLDVELPAARRGLVAAVLFAAALALGEFTATYFLAVPKFATATVEMYDLLASRWVPEAWALGAFLALATLLALAGASFGGQRAEL